MSEPNPPPGVLLPADVARILTEEVRKTDPDRDPIKVSTVWSYSKESRIAGGRYLDNPCPQPDGYSGRNKNGPWWTTDREQEWRDWWHSRPGRESGYFGNREG